MKKSLTLLTLLVFASMSGIFAQSFFTNTNFVGAMGTTDWTSGWANFNPQATTYPATTTTVSGNITTNTTWTKSNVYLLSGFVYVKSGATLTIEPGTIIRGDQSTKGTLIVTRGSKLMASGTATEPIIFTSNQAAGSRNYGDWGGLIILGKAKINVAGGTASIEGGVDNSNGDGQYGGTDDDDNSGMLKYVRVEFPGIAFQPNSEINGITFGAVGKKTEVDFIQVSYSGDDSYEWFGGAVNLKHIIAFRGWDDDFDTDFGYSGMVQYGISYRDSAKADVSASHSFECDNDGTGSTNTPITSAFFSNITAIGPKVDASNPINSNYKRALHIRRNCRVSIYNSIFMGYPIGFYLDGGNTLSNAKNNDLQFQNNIFAGCPKTGDTTKTSSVDANFDIVGWIKDAKNGNRVLTANSDVMLTNPFNYDAPNLLPKTGSPALAGYSFNNTRLGAYFNLGVVAPLTASFSFNAYPNPASSLAQIQMNINKSGRLMVELLDMQGRMIQTLHHAQTEAGVFNISMETSHLSQGTYFIRATQNGQTQTLRLTVSH